MDNVKILWVDDEIDLLKPHVMFLEDKGYEVITAQSGDEALDLIEEHYFDIVFLDENMPGLSGLDTLAILKNKQPQLPVVMITKSEEESIMEDAIGSNIADYLIKPVNPKQVLLSIKKNLDNKELISKKTTSVYQQEFSRIGLEMSPNLTMEEWISLYKRIVGWDIKLEQSDDNGMNEVISMQKQEANTLFAKTIEKNYLQWLSPSSTDKPLMSHTAFKEVVIPQLDANEPVFLLVIDNLRYDQWKALQPIIEEYYRVVKDDIYCSILPTATQYARNAFFAGLMPATISSKYPQYWVEEQEEGSKNKYEKELLEEQLKRYGKHIKFSYHKILSLDAGKKYVENIHNLFQNKLNVLVYNFVDMLSHARTDMEVIKELASDEIAYRSLTKSWFEHSPLMDVIKEIAAQKINLVITTDHGSIRVDTPIKIIGDKQVTSNLRYKAGKSLAYNPKEVFEIKDPTKAYLPKANLSTAYVFTKGSDFFAYPNNFNYYVSFYTDTFQHGGISLEEMLIPIISLKAK